MGEITKKKKNYVKGSAKLRIFDEGGELINVDLNYDDLGRLPRNAAGFLKLTFSRLREPDKYGNDYSMYENEYKPDPNRAKASAPTAPPAKSKTTDDLPF